MPPSSCLPPLCSTAQIFVLFVSDLMASSLTEYGHAWGMQGRAISPALQTVSQQQTKSKRLVRTMPEHRDEVNQFLFLIVTAQSYSQAEMKMKTRPDLYMF